MQTVLLVIFFCEVRNIQLPYREAMTSPDRVKWREKFKKFKLVEEVQALKDNDTFQVTMK